VAEQAVIVDEEETELQDVPRRAAATAPEGAGPRSNPANLESRAAARHLLSSLNCGLSAWLSIFHSATSRCPATLHEKARSSCGSPSRYRWLDPRRGRRPPYDCRRGRPGSNAVDLALKIPSMIVLTATLTCPHCGHKKTETMPANACVHFYECSACRTVLRPKPGDCCVFCSYGSVKCPSRQ